MKIRKILAVGLLAALLLSGCGAQGGSATAENDAVTPKIDLEDGGYTVDFNTDSNMFQANEACDRKGTLTVQDGQANLHVSLGSKNIVNLYLGLAADAENDEQNWLQPTIDTVTYSDGLSEEVHGFNVPVSVIGEEFDLALIGKKGIWYDHKVSVQNPVPVESSTGAPADGSYTCQVTLSGGSGRASIDSPAAIVVNGKNITATIVWSSPHYEYMLVDGVQYDPIQTEGNSTFKIPVVLDKDMAVSASTVAMSQPHLVDYTLHFDSATLKEE